MSAAMDVKNLEAEVEILQKKLDDAKKEKTNVRTRNTEIVVHLARAAVELDTKKKRKADREKVVKIRCKKCGHAYGGRPTSIPKLLNCGHTICESCVRTIKQECPFDGQTVRPPFIVNQTILEHNAAVRVPVVTIE